MSGAGAPPGWPRLISQLVAGEDLSAADTAWAMGEVMAGETTPAQLAGFLVALRAKGETVAELEGLTAAMVERAVPLEVAGPTVDVVGTGGDRHHTVNISTMAAIVVAGAGHRVVKHGNRAASSASGSADVLEALGVALDLGPDRVAAMVDEVGITFCFAQVFHPAMRHAAVARRELGVPTAFNFLGPLTNPAQPRSAAVGVADERMAPLVAGVLARRGAHALVFRGAEGLDEMSTTAATRVWWVRDGDVAAEVVDAADLGLPRASLADLRGGDAAQNAAVVRRLLAGETGPVRDAVLLNAAAALVATGDGRSGLLDALETGVTAAAEAVDSGAAADVLRRWVAAGA